MSGFCHGDLTVLPFFPHSLGLRPFFRLRSSSPLSSVLSVLSAFQEEGGGGGRGRWLTITSVDDDDESEPVPKF